MVVVTCESQKRRNRPDVPDHAQGFCRKEGGLNQFLAAVSGDRVSRPVLGRSSFVIFIILPPAEDGCHDRRDQLAN